jgi:hypothetical protein
VQANTLMKDVDVNLLHFIDLRLVVVFKPERRMRALRIFTGLASDLDYQTPFQVTTFLQPVFCDPKSAQSRRPRNGRETRLPERPFAATFPRRPRQAVVCGGL